MCLLFLAWRCDARRRLIAAGNRDEFHAREALPLDARDAGVLAGWDVPGDGTWLGIAPGGRFAALTNFREPRRPQRPGPSRGRLVADYLRGDASPAAYAAAIAPDLLHYAGFNLMLADADTLLHVSNRAPGPDGDPVEMPLTQALAPGYHAISNGYLGAPWPKVVRGRVHFARLAAAPRAMPQDYLRLLTDTTVGCEEQLPQTGVGVAFERVLSRIFIRSPAYGTRCSTVLQLDTHGGGTILEQRYRPDATVAGITSLTLPTGAAA
ncbi:MAG: NRDE family protein [Pseudomonadota bacterium]|nr:NRDE family protein [Pseudomonadota bacterium]